MRNSPNITGLMATTILAAGAAVLLQPSTTHAQVSGGATDPVYGGAIFERHGALDAVIYEAQSAVEG